LGAAEWRYDNTEPVSVRYRTDAQVAVLESEPNLL